MKGMMTIFTLDQFEPLHGGHEDHLPLDQVEHVHGGHDNHLPLDKV